VKADYRRNGKNTAYSKKKSVISMISKKSTIRSWREGHHPLGCLNIPLVTPEFLWILAGVIGDGDAVVYHHKQKQLDMFVVRLRTKRSRLLRLVKRGF